MKLTFALLSLLVSIPSLAQGGLSCYSSSGLRLEAAVSSDVGSVPSEFKAKVGGPELKAYPEAIASQFETEVRFVNGQPSLEAVRFLVVTDPFEGILAVIRDGVMVDKTGSYPVECEFVQ